MYPTTRDKSKKLNLLILLIFRIKFTNKKLVMRDLPLNPAPLYFLLCLITPTPYGSTQQTQQLACQLIGSCKN